MVPSSHSLSFLNFSFLMRSAYFPMSSAFIGDNNWSDALLGPTSWWSQSHNSTLKGCIHPKPAHRQRLSGAHSSDRNVWYCRERLASEAASFTKHTDYLKGWNAGGWSIWSYYQELQEPKSWKHAIGKSFAITTFMVTLSPAHILFFPHFSLFINYFTIKLIQCIYQESWERRLTSPNNV